MPAKSNDHAGKMSKHPAIDNIPSLKRHLQAALELEHATIPLYLTALYSIEEGTNEEAVDVIRSVVVEEMLHMSLVANLLNAIDGEPSFNHKDFMPVYPGFLSFSDDSIYLRLQKFSKESVRVFKTIEQPATLGAPPQADHYHTIGQFYAAIENGLKYLCKTPDEEKALFCGDQRLQVGPGEYYGSGGELFAITNLEEALTALTFIVEEGEGLPGQIADGDHLHFDQEDEPAHFFRFNQLLAERYYTKEDTPRGGPTGVSLHVDWTAVHDMAPDPDVFALPPGSALRQRSLAFNSSYCRLLDRLHSAFTGHPDQFAAAIALMYELKYAAKALMQMHLPDSDKTAGPSFQYIPPDDRI